MKNLPNKEAAKWRSCRMKKLPNKEVADFKQTDGWTSRLTDTPSYRDAWPHQKRDKMWSIDPCCTLHADVSLILTSWCTVLRILTIILESLGKMNRAKRKIRTIFTTRRTLMKRKDLLWTDSLTSLPGCHKHSCMKGHVCRDRWET